MGKDEIRIKHIDTVHGWVEYERQRYRCSRCGKWHYPADMELELSGESRMSPKKEDELLRLSVLMPYRDAKKTYEELQGLRTSRSAAQRIVSKRGAKVKENKQIARHKPLKGNGKEHVGADGVLINIRREGWKEVKVGVYYKTDGEREKESQRYVATTDSRGKLGEQLYEIAGRPGWEHGGRMGFISDGAPWLEDMRKEHFPQSTGILDYYHASSYVGTLGKVFYGEERSKEWIKAKIERLKQGDIQKLRYSFKRMKPKTDEQREQLLDTSRYFKNHGHKMRYPQYKEMGLHISSGVIEAACKHVIQTRFKRSGMRWSRQGAENLLALRVAYLNDDWDLVRDACWN